MRVIFTFFGRQGAPISMPAWSVHILGRPILLLLATLGMTVGFVGCKANADVGVKSPAETTPVVRLMSEAEVKTKYQNCVGGHYSGPRPGKARFAQDPWIWVVTPDFARRFCMPAEFVSAELRGAEAVAFRVLRKTDSVNCGFANNPAVCFGEPVIRFDVYVKSDAELPRKHKLPIYHVPDMPSMKMISRSPLERAAGKKYISENPTQYGYPHFGINQVALQGIKDGLVEWPITILDEEEHRAQALEGLDYYSFEGMSGAFQNTRMLKLKITEFQISFKLLNEVPRESYGRRISEFPYAIKFPKEFSVAVVEGDIKNGRNFSQDIRDAFASRAAIPTSK